MLLDMMDYIAGFIKIMVYKILYVRRLKYGFLSRISKKFELRLFDKSRLIIGKKVVIRSGVKIRCNGTGRVIIGDEVGLNNNCLINALDRIEIGSHTIIGQDVKMYDHDHEYKVEGNRRYTGFKTSAVIIGKNVWIGSGCIILRGTTIGDNCVIGAGTIVKGNVSSNTVIYNRMNIEEKKLYEEKNE